MASVKGLAAIWKAATSAPERLFAARPTSGSMRRKLFGSPRRYLIEEMEGRLLLSGYTLDSIPLPPAYPNGINPESTLSVDANGNMFGTTYSGGAYNLGTVFEIDHASHSVSIVASFTGTNGSNPKAGLTIDPSGNLFGTTYQNGSNGGNGTVFEIVHGTATISTIANFDGAHGQNPTAGVTLDASGNLFGTTYYGGNPAYNTGVVYEIANGTNVITVLGSFIRTNGALPTAGVTLDADGNLYGTALSRSSRYSSNVR